MSDITEHEFRVYLKLGNDAMSTEADIAQALRDLADKLDTGYVNPPGTSEGHSIRDLNGNTVGSWSIKVPDES